MVMYKKAYSVAKINFQRWKNDQRVWIIFIFVGVLLVRELWGLTRYGLDEQLECTGYLLCIVFNGGKISVGFLKTMLYLGCLLLLCDAPFIYQITPYVVLRSRRESWWMGECLYILAATFLYTFFILLVSTLVVLPVATFGDSWGKVIQDFAFGNSSTLPRALSAYYNVGVTVPLATIGYLYPSGAQFYTFFSVWASFFVLGLLQYLVSLVSRSMFFGFASAGIFVLLDPILNELSVAEYFQWVQMLSPVSWVNTNSLRMVDRDAFLTIPYVVTMFVVLIVVLLLAVRTANRRVIVEVRGEV